ncbi:hypothetical protein FQA39_LY14293 [Lamprigera yunnana]|nr:hypothetical protein FQA39_LY14293 [Lamprigera yunnana]
MENPGICGRWIIDLEYFLNALKSLKHEDFQTAGENVQEILCERTTDKSVQAFIIHKFRSKAVQAKVQVRDQSLSPLKVSLTSSSTSPFKVQSIIKSIPSPSGLSKITKHMLIQEEHSDSDISLYTPSIASNSHSSSMHLLQVESSSNCKQHWTKDNDLKSAVKHLYEKMSALEFDANHEAIYGMERYYIVQQCEHRPDKYKVVRRLCRKFLKGNKFSQCLVKRTSEFGL